jgi:hypothetical protein
VADIIDISTRFRKPPPKPTVTELAQFCADEILSHWEKFASNNRLNDYFTSSTPMYCKGGVNYLEDLNALSLVEQKVYLEPQVIAPGFNEKNALGWIAAFRLNGVIVATPFMVSEQYARCFLILLFLKLKREMKDAGLPLF